MVSGPQRSDTLEAPLGRLLPGVAARRDGAAHLLKSTKALASRLSLLPRLNEAVPVTYLYILYLNSSYLGGSIPPSPVEAV